MLTTQNEETNILERIKIARGNAEPQEPTEEPQIVDVSEDAPDELIEEVAEVEQATEEAEEIEQEFEEPVEELYIELDGEEVSLTDVKAWKAGNMMQADYTRKTTEHAREVEQFNEQREAFNANQAKLNESIANLESLIVTDELTTEQLQEMRDYEPDEYIKHIEKQNKRKEALQAAKSAQVSQPSFDPQEELTKLVSSNPQWLDNGKPTKAYQKDQELLNNYALEVGITADKFSQFDASMMQMALDAAKFKASNNKSAAVLKKVRKAPVVTKPKSTATKGIHDDIKAAEAKLKKSGRMEDAVALRKLKSKLNNN